MQAALEAVYQFQHEVLTGKELLELYCPLCIRGRARYPNRRQAIKLFSIEDGLELAGLCEVYFIGDVVGAVGALYFILYWELEGLEGFNGIYVVEKFDDGTFRSFNFPV